jgi:hypothetical protein
MALRRTGRGVSLGVVVGTAVPLGVGQPVLLEVAEAARGGEGVPAEALAAEEALGVPLGFREALALPEERLEAEAAPLALGQAEEDTVRSTGLGVAVALREECSLADAAGEALALGLPLGDALAFGLCEPLSGVELAHAVAAAE